MIQYTFSNFIESNLTSQQQPHTFDTSFLGNYVERNQINQNIQNSQNTIPNNQNYTSICTSSFSTISNRPWQISEKLKSLLNEFQETILYDHPSISCAYCSILMLNQMTNWIDYDTTEEYTLPIAFPNTKIVTHINNRGKTKIAVCSSCKSERTHRYLPILSPIPKEINAIPMIYRKNLSPIHMNCTLG